MADVFADIRKTLGLPTVSWVFQVYGNYPEFLELTWQTLKPAASTIDFHQCVSRLNADAFTRVHTYLEVPNLASFTAAAPALSSTIDLYFNCDPLWLMICSLHLQALEGPIGRMDSLCHLAPLHESAAAPLLLEEAAATPQIRKTYVEIRRMLDLPVLNEDYQALAHWPQFFHTFWQCLKPNLTSPMYKHCKHSVLELAWLLVHEVPGPIEIPTAKLMERVSEEDIASLIRITETFVRDLSALILNMAFAKIALEGGSRKQRDRDQSEKGPLAAA